MERSDELQRILEEILGSKNVYFQPPSSVKIKYPCIIFQRAPSYRRFANNRQYVKTDRYSVTLISNNSDSQLIDKLLELPMININRAFTKDNLYHSAFTLYY